MIYHIMPENQCIECGKIINPGEGYYIDCRNNAICIECANNENNIEED